MFEEYIKGDSIIHRLDPRVKIIYAFVFSIVTALKNNLVAVLFGFGISIMLIILARISLKEIIKRLIVVNEFILILWLFLPLTFPGEKLFSFHRLAISQEGVIFTLVLTIKANAIVLILVSLLATSSIFDIVHGLRHLGMPDKLVFLFFLIFRYTWVIFDEYEKIVRAIKARGFKLKTSIHTYRTIAYLVGSLLVKSYNRSENLYKAMSCRGFSGKFWILDHFRFSLRDAIAIVILTFGNILIMLIRWKIII